MKGARAAATYQTEEKAHYRKRVWDGLEYATSEAWLRYTTKRKRPSNGEAHVAILPGPTGLEIEHLLSRGYRQEHIHAIERNPAALAHFEWTRQFPRVKRYGVSVGRAFDRIAASGVRLAAANLDFCGNFSDEVIEDVRRAGRSGAFDHLSAVAVTLLRGREQAALVAALKLAFPGFDKPKGIRIVALGKVLADNLPEWPRVDVVVGPEEYRSKTQVMEWGVFGIWADPEREREKIRSYWTNDPTYPSIWNGNVGVEVETADGPEFVRLPKCREEFKSWAKDYFWLRDELGGLTKALLAVGGLDGARSRYRHGHCNPFDLSSTLDSDLHKAAAVTRRLCELREKLEFEEAAHALQAAWSQYGLSSPHGAPYDPSEALKRSAENKHRCEAQA